MRLLIAAWRSWRILLHVLGGIWTVYAVFPRLLPQQKKERIQAWALALLAQAAIKLIVTGQPAASGPMLLAANHISWLDIMVLHAARYCRFVSKSELKHWPLVGTLATAAGTLYIERDSRRDAMRVVHRMAECLQQGDVLAVFPEGTTGDGTQVLPFHANLLQAAISANAPVQPISLHFADELTGAVSFAPCYVGNDTLIASLWRTLSANGVVAVLNFGEPQWAQGRDRRVWAADLRSTITALRGEVKLPG
jgi:1-acyl-sn-glycerol-3-phosphate acyltransferase